MAHRSSDHSGDFVRVQQPRKPSNSALIQFLQILVTCRSTVSFRRIMRQLYCQQVCEDDS